VAQEPDVEAGVVGHQGRAVREFEERGQDRFDAGGVRDHLVGDAGQARDPRVDGLAGVDEGAELADDLAALDLDGADLGDPARVGGQAGGLEVDDAEGHFGQRGAEAVEGRLGVSGVVGSRPVVGERPVVLGGAASVHVRHPKGGV
jgi:hypothetical protein